MAWHLLEKMVERSASHSTVFGKWWIAILFVFRIIVVASILDSVYSDEQDEFKCTVKNPGCKQSCYDYFAPISHLRFWSLQIIATGMPTLIFIIYSTHKLARIPTQPIDDDASKSAATQTLSQSTKTNYRSGSFLNQEEKKTFMNKTSKSDLISTKIPHQEETQLMGACKKQKNICRENKIRKSNNRILSAYVITVICRIVSEAGCLYLQVRLYGWEVPPKIRCDMRPCVYTAECYISRPTEKTFFLLLMFGVGVLCFIINVMEMFFLIWKRARRHVHHYQSPPMRTSFILGTCPVSDVEKVHSLHQYEERGFQKISRPPLEPAPPGYYIPHVEPPTEMYKAPANGFPPIRIRAASYTTSETDVTTDDDRSIESVDRLLLKHARRY